MVGGNWYTFPLIKLSSLMPFVDTLEREESLTFQRCGSSIAWLKSFFI